MRSIATLLAALVLATTIHASPALGPETAVMEIRFPGEKSNRRVVLGLYDQAAPSTVANFKELVRKKFYRGMRFHRAFPDSLVQTGDPDSRRGQSDSTGTGGPGYTIPAEIGLKNLKGSVAMARLPDNVNPARRSNGSQFYVCLQPMPKLDGDYTVFATVLDGLDTLEEISRATTNSNDFPLPKITIKSILLTPRDQAP